MRPSPVSSRYPARSLAALAGVLILTFFPRPARAGTGRWSSIGPEGADVTAVAVGGHGTVYAGLGSYGSVSVVTSSGSLTSWKRSDAGIPAPRFVDRILADPVDPFTAYLVGRYDNSSVPTLWRSRDSGATWAALPLAGRVVSIAAAASDDSSVLYAAVTSDLWKSVDRGDTWTSLGVRAYRVLVSRSRPDVIVIRSEQGTSRSTDGGVTWIPVAHDVLAVDPTDPSVLYGEDEGLRIVARSSNGGGTWTLTGGQPRFLQAVTVDPRNPASVWVLTGGGLYRSADRGDHWTDVTPPGNDATPPGNAVSGIAFDPATGHVLAGDRRVGMWRSEDDGASWHRARALSRSRVVTLAAGLDRSGPLYVWGLGCVGISRSTDGGRTWCCLAGAGLEVFAVNRGDDRIVYGIIEEPTEFLFGRSVDGGETWISADPALRDIQRVVSDPNDSRVLYATGYSSSAGVGTIFRTADAGATWQPLASVPFQGIGPIAVDPAHPSTLYLGGGQCVETAPSGACSGFHSAIFRSNDTGASWVRIETSAEFGSLPFLFLPPWDGGALYLVGDVDLQVSRDGGATWRRLRDWLYPLIFDETHPSVMYGVDSRGVWRSADEGETWALFGESPDGDTFRSLVLDRTGTVLRAGTDVSSVVEYQIPSERVTLSTSAGEDFEVSVTAEDPASGRPLSAVGSSHSSRAAVFHFPGLTGDAENAEVAVKVVDGRAVDGAFWVFHGGLTSVPYSVAVRRISTGAVRTYSSDGCGAADALAFPAAGLPAAGSPPPICTPASDREAAERAELELDPGRPFTVTVSARDPRTGSAIMGVAARESGRVGTFSLPDLTDDTSNPEVLVKILDGRAVNGRFWLFYGSLTDVEYTVTVTDRTTGRTRVYSKAAGASCGGVDTETFAE